MYLIPLASILSLLTAGVALVCATLILIRQKSYFAKNILPKGFFYSFIMIAISLLLCGSPGIITEDLITIQVLYMFNGLFAQIATTYLVFIALVIFFPDKEKIFTIITALPMTVYTFYWIIHDIPLIQPAERIIIGSFVDWKGAQINSVTLVIGLAMQSLNIFIFAGLFFIKGWFHVDSLVRQRSRFLVTGLLVILLGAALAQLFVFVKTAPGNTFLLSGTIAAIAGSIGFILLLCGVLITGTKKA
ncbi:MAG: hypothetical protein WC628_10345 [Candidatus Omnitrophota bacterium]